MATFDPYHKWLGIPPKDQPPTLYRLLGLDRFESDPEIIDAAANRQMTYLKQVAAGSHAAASQRLLAEISAARLRLLDPEKKAAYDRSLAKRSEPSPPENSELADAVEDAAPIVVHSGSSRSRRSSSANPAALWISVMSLVGLIGGGVWYVTGPGKSMFQTQVVEKHPPKQHHEDPVVEKPATPRTTHHEDKPVKPARNDPPKTTADV
ncbi:MAG TPA: hypothetical protein VHB77_10585, partial [Planctomycetaceae bacterium]|nr:hypothetical protein [Planctomycetaceae bacterium]